MNSNIMWQVKRRQGSLKTIDDAEGQDGRKNMEMEISSCVRQEDTPSGLCSDQFVLAA